MLNKREQPCFCGSKKHFDLCCRIYIDQLKNPTTAEQLMRSRYSAYVLNNENYLLHSWHKSTRPESLELKNDSTKWMGLKIISSGATSVEFVAYFTQDILNKDKIYALTEVSHFIKDDRWQYIEGEKTNTVQLTKNMQCPCKSGKKFKRCCENQLN